MKSLYTYRFLILRRTLQGTLLLLFAAGNYWGWNLLKGNYSAGLLFGKVHFADPYAALQILATGFIAGADVLIGAVTVLLLYGLLFGRMFCSWVCPVNIIADTAVYGSRKLQIVQNLKLSKYTRYAILVLGLVLSFFLSTPAFEMISPVSMVHRAVIFGTGGAWAVILAIFLFDLAVVKYGWCGHLCPIGAFYSLVGKFAVIKVRHTAENCTDCGKCFRVCPEEQVLSLIHVRSGFIEQAACTNCMRCVEVCNDNALKPAVRNPLSPEKNTR